MPLKTKSKKNSKSLSPMTGNHLVVVESPAKAKTIGKLLGKNYRIAASMGHVRDLPKGKLGIDIENSFSPSYSVMKGKAAIIKELKTLGENASSIYLATDPDREGEAISWHVVNATGWDKQKKNIRRVVFHEITETAIKEAMKHSRDLDLNLVDAQQTRRILDRLVGYELSPLLWRKVQRGLSAGRVQSVALRIIVDREREIEAFVPTEYWSFTALLKKGMESFETSLHSIKGNKHKLVISNQAEAKAIDEELKGAVYTVAKVKTNEKTRAPAPPFTTSTLQQESARRFRFSAKKTMIIAQQLYEGIEIGSKETVGLITYMRTDSVSLSTYAIDEARTLISKQYGKDYLPDRPRTYKTKSKGAQEAHEAIRPTSIFRSPDSMEKHLNRDQLRLYRLIWRRMVACQMKNSIYFRTTIDIESHSSNSGNVYVFQTHGTQTKFSGFLSAYSDTADDRENDENRKLPKLNSNDKLECVSLKHDQKFTQPPLRFTEGSLIKTLEEEGIGRPSTYAPILSTLMDRNYVVKNDNKLDPTLLGIEVANLLTKFFPTVMDVTFTAKMEDELDFIATGKRKMEPVLKEFYFPFKKHIDHAHENMPRIKIEEPTDEICELCESSMVIKSGRFGRFIACSAFPECRHTKAIVKGTGVECPLCSNELIERRSRTKGRLFYGCSSYPNCDFSVVNKPISGPCPECSGLMVSKGRSKIACSKCAWQGEPTAELMSSI
jgi:DNA topoisomerase-1